MIEAFKLVEVFLPSLAEKRWFVSEFPELAARVNIRLLDEKSQRVGQSIAVASLPATGWRGTMLPRLQ